MSSAHRCLPVLVAACLVWGCSGVHRRTLGGPAQEAAESPSPPGEAVLAEGAYTVLGGEILETRPADDGGTILVIRRRPLTPEGPSTQRYGEGSFGVRYPDTLDPHLFRRGQRVSVRGVVRGQSAAPGGDAADPAVWLNGEEVRLWGRPEWPLMTRLRGQKQWLPWWYDPYYGRRPWWW